MQDRRGTWVKLPTRRDMKTSNTGNIVAATTTKGTYSCHCGRHKVTIYL